MLTELLIICELGLKIFSLSLDNWASKLPLFLLRLAVYSNSSLLAMTFLSIFGLIHGIAHVPKKRLSGAKSLLHYGVEVLQHGLHPSTKGFS